MEFDISRRLRELREERGYSAYKLAQISGVAASHINRIEKDGANPTLDILNKLCAGLDISISDFFNEDNADASPGLMELMKNARGLTGEQLDALNFAFRAERVRPKFLEFNTPQLYNNSRVVKQGDEVVKRRAGRPPSENPKSKTLKLRVDEETDDMLDKCSEELRISRAEVIRAGIKWIYDYMRQNKPQ